MLVLYVAWVVLHRNRHIADTTFALSGSIFGAGKSIEIRLRKCGPPLFQISMLFAKQTHLYFCSDGSAFAVDFAILRSHFWSARRS